MLIGNQTGKFFSPSEGVNRYLAEIKKYTVPTTEEELELAIQAKEGNEKAGKELVMRNQRFVYSIAKIYARDESEILDYVNEGTIGMYTAIEKYDPTKGTKYITCASWYIRRAMFKHLCDIREMVTRTNNMKIGNKIDKIKNKFYVEGGRVPTPEEIADLMKEIYKIDIKDTKDVYDISVSSIDENIDDDYTLEDDSEFTEKTASSNNYELEAEKEYNEYTVKALLQQLPVKKATILKKLYGIGCDEMSPQQVAEEFGVSEASILNTKKRAIEYLYQKNYGKIVL